MSLRAIKKRDQPLNTTAATTTTAVPKGRQNLFTKSQTRRFPNTGGGQRVKLSINTLQQQSLQLGRATQSNPELRRQPTADDTVERLASACLVRTKSESDVSSILNSGTPEQHGLISAKSEVCLQTISSHSYNSSPSKDHSQMDCNQQRKNSNTAAISSARRRLSECSLSSNVTGYSQRTSAMSSSALTLSSRHTPSNPAAVPHDPNAVTRVPIIGYEVMEERARFTVYKLRVENPHTNDCWLVLRRYTDFVRLNTKLKQSFPYITLLLPRKKIFGDNFNAVFLDNRVQGLQMFVNSIMAKEELRRCKLVREFFCLDEAPSYSESMEECRAIFEAQEETISHLKLQINNKNDLILSLQQKLREEINAKTQLKEALRNFACGTPQATTICARCASPSNLATTTSLK